MKEASRAGKEPSRGIPGFRTSLPSRLKVLWRRSNDHLQGHQDLLLASVLLLTAAIGILVVVKVIGLVWKGSGGDPGAPAIVFEGEIRETELPKTKYRPAAAKGEKDGAGKDAVPLAARLPRIDWADRELRRRAASQVSLTGDLQGALKLLPPDDPDREELLKVPASGHEEVLKALEEVFRAEDRRLEDFLKSSFGDAGGAGDPRSPAAPAPPEKGPPARSRADLLRGRSEGLPEAILFRFVVNLHCALRDRTGASDAHVKLVLEPCFPPRSGARRPYLERKELKPLPYRSVQGADRRGM